mmetsp:Transcript_37180/g.106453  ORF Transcript_37180/g.106453 Transcript_37180/m.106453 type:complete len:285 (-) Transcript_37180:456-1310(-)
MPLVRAHFAAIGVPLGTANLRDDVFRLFPVKHLVVVVEVFDTNVVNSGGRPQIPPNKRRRSIDAQSLLFHQLRFECFDNKMTCPIENRLRLELLPTHSLQRFIEASFHYPFWTFFFSCTHFLAYHNNRSPHLDEIRHFVFDTFFDAGRQLLNCFILGVAVEQVALRHENLQDRLAFLCLLVLLCMIVSLPTDVRHRLHKLLIVHMVAVLDTQSQHEDEPAAKHLSRNPSVLRPFHALLEQICHRFSEFPTLCVQEEDLLLHIWSCPAKRSAAVYVNISGARLHV